MNNADRVDRFATALQAVAGNEAASYVEQEILIDLLANAMHWCDANGEDSQLRMRLRIVVDPSRQPSQNALPH